MEDKLTKEQNKEIEKQETKKLVSNIFEWLETKSITKIDSFYIHYKDEFLNIRIKYTSGIEETLSFCLTPDKKYFYPLKTSTIERE